MPWIDSATKTTKPHEVYLTPKSESINGANFIDKAYDVASVSFTLDTDFGVIKSITAKQEFYDQFNGTWIEMALRFKSLIRFDI